MKKKIYQIGGEMVNWNEQCAGILCDRQEGVIPRCLILESEGREANMGCVVIRINPERATEKEVNFYRKSNPTYEALLAYWAHVGSQRYYRRLRNFLDQVGLMGPILWTELAKCQNAPGTSGSPPLMTLRRCTGLYLSRELTALPTGWPLIAVGGEAFKALVYLYPQRTVIGVPNPTGSYGHFLRLMPGGEVLQYISDSIWQILDKPSGELLWLEVIR